MPWLGRNTALDKIMAGLFVLFVLGIAAFGMLFPSYPYDLVAYIGAALLPVGVDQSHAQAWGLIREAAPPDVYQDLSTANPYRVAQSTNPEAFASIAPLYTIKLGYISLLQALGPILGWVKSAQLINLVAVLAIGTTSLFWMVTQKTVHAAPVVAATLFLIGYADAAQNPVPDALATALFLPGLMAWLTKRQSLACIFFFAAFLIRPDTIIFALALTLASILIGEKLWKPLVLFLAMLTISVVVRGLENHPGWWVHYYFSNVTIQNSLVGFEPPFAIMDWLKGMARGVYGSLTQSNWPALLILLFAGCVYIAKAAITISREHQVLIMACIATIGGKFLLFPLPDDRLYMAFILGGALLIADVVKPKIGWSTD